MKTWTLLATIAISSAGCLTTTGGESVGEGDLALVGTGPCATLAQIDDACPANASWKNHGKYVSCVAHYLDRRLAAGDLTPAQTDALQSLAARSQVGKVDGAPGPSFAAVIGDADGDGVADRCPAGDGAAGHEPANPQL